jgi:hypothetical protein
METRSETGLRFSERNAFIGEGENKRHEGIMTPMGYSGEDLQAR